eukprot:gene29865-37258_t
MSADLPCCATISTGEAIFDEVEFYWFTQFKVDYKIDIYNGYEENSEWPESIATTLQTWSTCQAFDDLEFDLSNEAKFSTYFNDDTKFRFHNLGNFTGGNTLSDYLKLTTESSPYVASITRTQFDTGFLGYTDGSKCVFMAYEALDYELTEYGSNAKFTMLSEVSNTLDTWSTCSAFNDVDFSLSNEAEYDTYFNEDTNFRFHNLGNFTGGDTLSDYLKLTTTSGPYVASLTRTQFDYGFLGYTEGSKCVFMAYEALDYELTDTGEAIFDEVEFYWFTQFKADYKIDISNGYNEASGFNDMNFSLSSEAEYATYFNEDTILRLHNLGLFTGDTVVSDYLKLTVDSSPYVDSLTRLDFDTGFLGYTDGSKCVFMAYEVLEYKLTDLGGKAKFN